MPFQLIIGTKLKKVHKDVDENKSKEYNDYAADKSILDSKEFHEQLDLEDIDKEFNHDEFNEYIMEKVDTSIDDVTILPTQTGRNEIEDYADLKFKNILEDKKVDKENGEQAFSRVCFIDDPFCDCDLNIGCSGWLMKLNETSTSTTAFTTSTSITTSGVSTATSASISTSTIKSTKSTTKISPTFTTETYSSATATATASLGSTTTSIVSSPTSSVSSGSITSIATTTEPTNEQEFCDIESFVKNKTECETFFEPVQDFNKTTLLPFCDEFSFFENRGPCLGELIPVEARYF